MEAGDPTGGIACPTIARGSAGPALHGEPQPNVFPAPAARVLNNGSRVPAQGRQAMTNLVVELPDELVALLGSPAAAAARAREALVLDLLREGQIGQSHAAELLGLTRWDLLDLMARHQITSGPK